MAGAALCGGAAAGAPALPAFSHQRAHLFAICSGRLAALATHQSSTQQAAAPESRRLQAEFDMLLDAVMPDAMDQGVPDGQADRWRSQGWSEIAGHLANAYYSFDATVAEYARNATADRIAECRDLLLPPTP
ncbi:MAG: hypothetical protein CML66_05550 [Rhodobacteraceae bacterium]|nr:hypothetical protein [Paracoccaceae bacterium]